MTHSIDIRVRYPECDPMGYVHHSQYFKYFEMGRIELLRSGGFAYADVERLGFFFVVVKLEARFKAPARFDEVLTLVTTVARQTMVRIDHTYVLKREQTVVAEGSSTIACVDRAGQLQQMPAFLDTTGK